MDESTVIARPYKDDDLVYVDPKNKCIVGLVEFSANGLPKKRAMPIVEEEEVSEESAQPDPKKRRRVRRTRYYPWGTYRSMLKVYKIEGKVSDPPRSVELEPILQRALKEPYWNTET